MRKFSQQKPLCRFTCACCGCWICGGTHPFVLCNLCASCGGWNCDLLSCCEYEVSVSGFLELYACKSFWELCSIVPWSSCSCEKPSDGSLVYSPIDNLCCVFECMHLENPTSRTLIRTALRSGALMWGGKVVSRSTGGMYACMIRNCARGLRVFGVKLPTKTF